MRPERAGTIAAAVVLPLSAALDCAVPESHSAIHAVLRVLVGISIAGALAAVAWHFSPDWGDFRWKLFAIGGILLLFLLNLLLPRLGVERVRSLLGLPALVLLAFLFCPNRKTVSARTVVVGLVLQLFLAFLILFVPGVKTAFDYLAAGFMKLNEFTIKAMGEVFGVIGDPGKMTAIAQSSLGKHASGFILALHALPVIIVIGAISKLLYHYGVLQRLVHAFAYLMRRTMKVSGAESLSGAANIFLGMVESPLLVKPYLQRMTESELFALMTTGMATVAGSVMAVYMGFVGNELAVHLLCASVISVPASFVVAKIMIPETGHPATSGDIELPGISEEDKTANAMDAVAKGASEGTALAISVTGMLIAFLALVAAANGILGLTHYLNLEPVTLEAMLGRIFYPVAVLMGISPSEADTVAQLLGTKTVLNECIGYLRLKALLGGGTQVLSEHARLVTIYALCGFANFGSVGIMIAGIGGMVPSRRSDVARLGIMAIVSGSIAAFMTACIAGAIA